MLERLAKVGRWIRQSFSARDVLCFGGLGCMGYGVGQIYPPAAWIVIGAALFWLAFRRRNDGVS